MSAWEVITDMPHAHPDSYAWLWGFDMRDREWVLQSGVAAEEIRTRVLIEAVIVCTMVES